MVDAIYSSKLFRASKRKDAIVAAFNHTSNAGLVMQLDSYLDDQYTDLATEEDEKKEKPEEASEEENTSAEGQEQESEGEGDEKNYEIPKSLHADLGDDFNPEEHLYTIDDENEEIPEASSDEGSAEPAPVKEEKPVEESTSIHACTDILSEVDVIKGSLNGTADTAGVNRIHVKDGEFWVYYNDNVNLNNIMTNVIEFFNATGRTYLEFNRLARSDNAMVFVINNVEEEIKPIEVVEGVKE